MVRSIFWLVLATAVAGCTEDTSPPDGTSLFEASSPLDRGPSTEATADSRPADQPRKLEARPDSTPLALPSTCTGTCSTQSVTAKLGTVTEPIERSSYGLERDAAGKVGVYVEAIHGGFAGCPTQSSPTPDRTLIVSGLPLPVDSTPITKSAGLAVTLLDFKGTLLKSAPMSKATAATVTYRAARVCESCLGKPAPSDPGGFVAFDLEATFPEGTVSGHLYAIHCDSLDQVP